MSNKMLSLIAIFVILLLNVLLNNSYPYFPTCSSSPLLTSSNLTILNTLNGDVQGTCYNITVNYASKPKANTPVMTWLAIPYAQPPLKTLRFKNPVPVESWSSIVDGTNWPSRCLQEYGKSTQNNAEDCLYLNLFVPYEVYANRWNRTMNAPILVWIHGGSLKSGSSIDDEFEPSTLAAMSNIIVININYRLNVYGFLHIKGKF